MRTTPPALLVACLTVFSCGSSPQEAPGAGEEPGDPAVSAGSEAVRPAPPTVATAPGSSGGPVASGEAEPVSRDESDEADLEDLPYPFELIEGEPMVTVVPQDGIPSIDEPRFVSAMEAFDFMQLEETVLGVVGADGTAKCYSAWQLDNHEIVNDLIDGEPIAATW